MYSNKIPYSQSRCIAIS